MNNTKKILATYMTLHGLNQKDMADLLDVTRQTFNYKINGRIPFKDTEKILIAELFKTDVGTIFFNNMVDVSSTKIVI